MTVDMLTATFFWPEAERLRSDLDGVERDETGAPDHEVDRGSEHQEGFWSSIRRHLRRPTPAVTEVGSR